MGKYISSKEFIEFGVLSIAMIIIFVYSLIDFIQFMKYRKRFYEDYISCFHLKEDSLRLRITVFVIKIINIVLLIILGRRLIVSLNDEYYINAILYIMTFILLVGLTVLDLLSTFIHMRTDYGISPEYISINSSIISKNKVVYEECDNEVVIYRKSRKKEKGLKLTSQAYDSNKDQKFLDYVHSYYQKVIQ